MYATRDRPVFAARDRPMYASHSRPMYATHVHPMYATDEHPIGAGCASGCAMASPWHYSSSIPIWRRRNMERVHMNYLRELIPRLRAGESGRRIGSALIV